MNTKKETGQRGEKLAKEFLKQKKLNYICSNFFYKKAEIDLIFEDSKNRIIIFIEVKTRVNNKYGEPEESINTKKINNMIKAASGFLADNEKYEGYDIRFDSISILGSGSVPVINHTENIT